MSETSVYKNVALDAPLSHKMLMNAIEKSIIINPLPIIKVGIMSIITSSDG